MRLGLHLRELTRQRTALALSFVLAVFLALSVSSKVSIFPPRVQPRDLEMGTASTRVLVDTSKSLVLDIRYGTGDFDSLTDRAVLLGTLMASLPVRQYIARRAHVPADAITATTPLTPDFPRPRPGDGPVKRQSDLLRSTDQYRLNIQANPTVPVIDVYAEAPDARSAQELANAAVDGLRDYMTQVVGTVRGLRADEQPLLTQLGRAHGSRINGGVRVQAFLLAFGFFFTLCCLVTFFVDRVRRGWRVAARLEEDAEVGMAR
jgi:hypothetical protein